MPDFKKERHRLVWSVLESLNIDLLDECGCYFGGGTRIVLELNEYRESLDLDFLCAKREGYRTLRGLVSQSSLGDMFLVEPELMREVRTDMYGIRTFLKVDGEPLKIEIVFEGRISLSSIRSDFPLEVLDHESCFAEKFLANTDRGLDRAVLSRDLIDLAFMSVSWSDRILTGINIAEEAYGVTVRRVLASTLSLFADKDYRRHCLEELGVKDSRKLNAGLRTLSDLVN
jgi:hypothetical protein